MKDQFEKSALKSKKFLAFLLIEAGFFGLMITMVSKGGYESSFNFLTTIVTAGFLASFFIGGQALVDKYTRVALIASGLKSKLGGVVSPPKVEEEESENDSEDYGYLPDEDEEEDSGESGEHVDEDDDEDDEENQ